MRSSSQEFCDTVKTLDIVRAQQLVETEGSSKTQALLWLAIYPPRDFEPWLDVINTRLDVSPDDIRKALAMSLATPAQSSSDGMAQWLIEQAPEESFTKDQIIHHAAAHGRDDIFDALEARHEAVLGRAFDWNNSTSSGATPLFLALCKQHVGTVVQVVVRGGSPTAAMPDSLYPGRESTVLAQAWARNNGVVGHLKSLWAAAADKAALLMSMPEHKATSGKGRRM